MLITCGILEEEEEPLINEQDVDLEMLESVLKDMVKEDEQDKEMNCSSIMTKEHNYALTSLSPFSPSPSYSSSSSSTSSQPSKKRRRRPLLTLKEELRVRRQKYASLSEDDRERSLLKRRESKRALKKKRMVSILVKKEDQETFVSKAKVEKCKNQTFTTSNNKPFCEENEENMIPKKKKKLEISLNWSNFNRPLTRSMTASANFTFF